MEEKEKKSKQEIGVRYWTGLALIVFLVLMNSFVKDIPVSLIAIPAILMGVDLTAIIKLFSNKK
jgi:hypothetical protein